MTFRSSDNVLRLSFGKFSKDSRYFKKNYDLTFDQDDKGRFHLQDSTLDGFASFSKARRADIDTTKPESFSVFCKNLMEDLARFIDMQARRGGYPVNHHSTFNVNSCEGKQWGEIKLSSDPGIDGNYDPENNKAHRGTFVGRPEQFRKMPY